MRQLHLANDGEFFNTIAEHRKNMLNLPNVQNMVHCRIWRASRIVTTFRLF
jgi:hypothetical protein